MPTGISIEITSPLRHLLFMPQSLDSEHMHKQADTHQGPQISYYNFLEEIRRVERKLSVFKIREANKHHCSANVCFPRWLSEVAPQALTCLDKGGSQWLSLCPEALSISHKLGLSVCLRKSHDSSWQLSVCYLKWAQGAMSNLGLELSTKEPRPLPVTLTRSGLEELMWQECWARSSPAEGAVSARFPNPAIV